MGEKLQRNCLIENIRENDMTYLPIGSIVQLENGTAKLMITTRFALYNDNGNIGYFDYAGCLYPSGLTDNQGFFFNHENIKQVWFEGYIDDSEREAQDFFKKEAGHIKYPKLSIDKY